MKTIIAITLLLASVQANAQLMFKCAGPEKTITLTNGPCEGRAKVVIEREAFDNRPMANLVVEEINRQQRTRTERQEPVRPVYTNAVYLAAVEAARPGDPTGFEQRLATILRRHSEEYFFKRDDFQK